MLLLFPDIILLNINYSTEDKHYHQFEHYDTTLTRFRYNTVF